MEHRNLLTVAPWKRLSAIRRFGFEPLPEDSAEDKEGNAIPQDNSVNEQSESDIDLSADDCGETR